MTLLDRALTKAYSQRSAAAAAPVTPPGPAAPSRGWVTRLRPPTRSTRDPQELPEYAAAVAANPLGNALGGTALDGAAATPLVLPELAPEPVRVTAVPVAQPPAAIPQITVAAATDLPDANVPGWNASSAQPFVAQQASVAQQAPASTLHPAMEPVQPTVIGITNRLNGETTRPFGWGWPTVCDRLLRSTGSGFQGFASLLRELLTDRGQRCVGFTGTGRGTGRTSLLLTVAKVLSETPGLRVALVDLDLEHPNLAQSLRVGVRSDLWQVACGQATTSSPLLTLIPGRLSLLPLRDRVAPAEISAPRAAEIFRQLEQLRNEFDLVLVDLGPVESHPASVPLAALGIESCICIARSGSQDLSAEGAYHANPGIDVLGVVETFVPAKACSGLPLQQ